MGKTVKSILDPGDFIFKQGAEQARKDSLEQARLDREAIQSAQPGSAPSMADVTAQREEERRRRAAAAGQSGTILTGAEGLAGVGGAGGKTLLGS